MTSGWQTCRSSGEGSSDGFFHSCRGGCAFAAARRPSEQICLCCGCAGCIQVRLVVNGVALSSAYWAELFSSLSFKQRKSQKQVKNGCTHFISALHSCECVVSFFPTCPECSRRHCHVAVCFLQMNQTEAAAAVSLRHWALLIFPLFKCMTLWRQPVSAVTGPFISSCVFVMQLQCCVHSQAWVLRTEVCSDYPWTLLPLMNPPHF